MDDAWVIGMLLTVGFLVIFASLWFLITRLLIHLSGWAGLQQDFPDRPDDPTYEKWSMATGSMGRSPIGGVSFRNCLVIEACQSGMRAKVWRVMAPFAKPIFVPWSQMKSEAGALGTTLLLLGTPEKGCLRVRSKFGRKIEAASQGQFTMPAK